ncbi:MAG: SURF1 family cytochrome oxidase biogenesis protein [Candidatus Planktophila sp.]
MFKKLLEYTSLLLIATIFVGLGLWQLDRAREMKRILNEAPPAITAPVPLESLAKPRSALDTKVDSKSVSASGFYVANFKAPNQQDGNGVVKDWEVALMQTDSTSAILVVRGLWSERLKEPQLAMSNRVDVVGVLRAHQNEDRSLNSPGVISRLDSSVIVGLTDLDLYDGYVIAIDEKYRDGEIARTRVSPELRTSRVPGFYWQHISYVVIWWLMAAVVLYLPIYRRRVAD